MTKILGKDMTTGVLLCAIGLSSLSRVLSMYNFSISDLLEYLIVQSGKSEKEVSFDIGASLVC